MVSNYSAPLTNHRRAIGTFPNRRAAEQALHELRDSGFPMERVSVVAHDSEGGNQIAGTDVSARTDNKADDGAKVGALSGGALGGLTGLLVGLGALAIPGIGPIMLAGAAATALATTAAGGAIGAAAGSLLGGLVGMGIPEKQARIYNDRVSAGEYLVMVDGTDAEISQAKAILDHRGIEEWGIYDIPTPVGTATGTPVAPAATPVSATPTYPAARVAEPTAAPTASDDEAIRLYQERLVVDKEREKTGEMSFGKHVEVETVRTSVPVDKERVVIERVPITGDTTVSDNVDAFSNAEEIHVEVYEEVADVRKEAFVREEVSIRKEVIQETVSVEETLRREELNLDTQGRPAIDDRH